MKYIKHFNESVLDGDFLVKFINNELEEFYNSHSFTYTSKKERDIIKSIFVFNNTEPSYEHFYGSKFYTSPSIYYYKSNTTDGDHNTVFNMIFERCDDEWWLVYDSNDFGGRNLTEYEDNEMIYLCDGIDGLKLLQSMMDKGKIDLNEKMWG